MKNFLYTFLVLTACTPTETDVVVANVSELNTDTLVASEVRFASDGIKRKLIDFPSYPVTYTGPDQCLPLPTDEFIEGRRLGTLNLQVDGLFLDDLYLYLQHALDSVSEKRFYKSGESQVGLIWGQEFGNGIFYCSEELESGGGCELWTRCKDEAAFFNAIEPVINYQPFDASEEYGWDDQHREFGPIDGGAGCYYSISTDSLGYFHLTSYCGC